MHNGPETEPLRDPEDESLLEGQSVSKSPRLFERLKRRVFGE